MTLPAQTKTVKDGLLVLVGLPDCLCWTFQQVRLELPTLCHVDQMKSRPAGQLKLAKKSWTGSLSTPPTTSHLRSLSNADTQINWKKRFHSRAKSIMPTMPVGHNLQSCESACQALKEVNRAIAANHPTGAFQFPWIIQRIRLCVKLHCTLHEDSTWVSVRSARPGLPDPDRFWTKHYLTWGRNNTKLHSGNKDPNLRLPINIQKRSVMRGRGNTSQIGYFNFSFLNV